MLAVGEDIHQLAQVEVYDIKRDANITLIYEGSPAGLLGQWVLMHIGSAMNIIDEDEAKTTLDTLRQMGCGITSAWWLKPNASVGLIRRGGITSGITSDCRVRRERLIRPTLVWVACYGER